MAKKILVVDDELQVIEMLRENLGARNYEVIGACDGKSALAKVFRNKPDLVLLDILMPGMDGFEVLRRLRLRRETKYLPVVMLTARGETECIFEAQDLGATDYIIKPFRLRDLLNLIKRYI